MDKGATFIKDEFARVELLKESASGSTEIVQGMDKQIFVRKIIPYINLPYTQLATLQHPALPLIYYVAEDAAHTYVIEEYISGQNLQELLEKKGSFSEKQVTNIALQLCQVLQVLHAHKILHRDIKPDNIILKNDGSIKLIDFGAARLAETDQHTHDTHILGTEGFAPPEQYGFAPTDVRSDLYAVGVTIKTLLGPHYQGRLLKIAGQCTQLDPSQRIASAADLEAALRAKAYTVRKKISMVLLALCLLALGYGTWNARQARNNKANIGTEQKAHAPEGSFSLKNTKIITKQDKTITQPKQETPQEQQTKATQQDNTAQGQATVELSTSGWNFAKVSLNDDRPQLAAMAKKAQQNGRTLVNFASNTDSPGVTVQNTSNVALHNPKVTFRFTNFGVMGTSSTINIGGNNKEITDFHTGSNKNLTQQLTVQLKGDIAPHDSWYVSLSLVDSFYLLGANPTIQLNFSAANAAPQETTLKININ